MSYCTTMHECPHPSTDNPSCQGRWKALVSRLRGTPGGDACASSMAEKGLWGLRPRGGHRILEARQCSPAKCAEWAERRS
ncbi:protein of unknown function [Candidatus Bipolaricaulis anaerobius]|uniref:Uncharacterized protein n=1 Tax=Candidatus Bipolaricaulis anaerobius TaxID=2026885 RepID=A0A2X3K7U8_9BACT|nr:protein of unknown function [Candidatus Bipolaricaulis anaerobius]